MKIPFVCGNHQALYPEHIRGKADLILRKRLQSKGTNFSKCLLKKRRRKEQLFARDVNHVISKKVVAKAEGTSRGIALEDLKGIRRRITASRSQRRSHHSRSFRQLRGFVEYKACLRGVPVVAVDSRNTSPHCPSCGRIHKANRLSQSLFSCVLCGFSGHADHIVAINMGRRASVNRPDVDATLSGEPQATDFSR